MCHRFVPFFAFKSCPVISSFCTYHLIWFIIGCMTWITWRPVVTCGTFTLNIFYCQTIIQTTDQTQDINLRGLLRTTVPILPEYMHSPAVFMWASFCSVFCFLCTFFFWQLYCLLFFDLQLLIMPLVPSKHLSYISLIYCIENRIDGLKLLVFNTTFKMFRLY